MAKEAKGEKRETIDGRIARLEEMIEELESGDAPLEVLLEKFEGALKLHTELRAEMSDTQKRVEVLIAKYGMDVERRPLESAESDAE